MILATMYKLDWRGRIVHVAYTEYHDNRWMTLVSIGYLTHTTDIVPGDRHA